MTERWHPFVRWLYGAAMIGVAVHAALSVPESGPDRILVGIGALFVGGWCLTMLLPTRYTPWDDLSARAASSLALISFVLIHRFRPEFLHGSVLGWSSWLYPTILGLGVLAAILRLFGRW